ncbi:MAG: hypothetical protein Q4F97_07760 [Bacteroidales bacterium]|nr:hypothetical protein [Bacteroidales bacterium]
MNGHLNLLLCIVCLFIDVSAITAQIDSVLFRNLITQTELYPHEKIYTMTDRSYYYAGDTVWLRSFIVNAATGLPDSSSIYSYIDLIDWRTRKVIRKVTVRRNEENIYKGYVALGDTLKSGRYILRSYTKYQLSDNEASVFSRIINVTGVDDSQYDEVKLYNRLSSDAASDKEKHSKKDNDNNNTVKNKSGISVRFYPEGGEMIAGNLSQVAFEALDKKDKPVYVYGRLYDSKNNYILDFKTLHRGIGFFSFIPQTGTSYYCVLKTRGNDSIKVSLPKAVSSGASLSAIPFRDNIKVKISATSDINLKEYRLMAVQGGFPLWMKEIDKSEFMINKSELKEGITSFVLVTLLGDIVSERKCFVIKPQGRLAVSGLKENYEKREKIELGLKDSNLRNSVCAVSVTNGAFDQRDNVQTARSWFLLSCEVKENMINPNVYLSDEDNGKYVDLLMMVKGWTRYNIENAMKGDFLRPQSLPETGIDIKGRALSLVRRRPVKGAVIRLNIPDYSFIQETVSDANGGYEFSNLEIPDSTTVWISGMTKTGDDNLLLKINDDTKKKAENSDILNSLNIYAYDWETQKTSKLDFAKVIENSSLRNYNLQEIEVRANRVEKPKVPVISKFSSLLPNAMLERKRTQSLKEILRTSMTGFFVNEKVITNGVGTLDLTASEEFAELRERFRYKGSICRLCIDDALQPDFMEEFWYKNLRGDAIEQIEIIDAISAVSFDMTQGGGPIIYITLRKGDVERDIVSPNFAFKLISSFQKPVDFYNPVYTEKNAKDEDKRNTLYWNPNLKFDANGEAKMEFYNSDNSQTIKIVVEGVSEKGEVKSFIL